MRMCGAGRRSEKALDLSNVAPDAIRELQRQAELCLQGTIQLALAADQRATTLTEVFGAGSVALLAADATLLTAPNENAPLIWSGLAASLMLFGGSLFCAWAARSIDFFVAGYEPRLLAPSATEEVWLVRYSTESLQHCINANRRALERSARTVRRGLVLALLTAPIAAIIFAVLRWFPVHPF